MIRKPSVKLASWKIQQGSFCLQKLEDTGFARNTADSNILVSMSQVLFFTIVHLSLFPQEITIVLQKTKPKKLQWKSNQTPGNYSTHTRQAKCPGRIFFFSPAQLHNFWCLPIIITFRYSISLLSPLFFVSCLYCISR